MSDPRPGETVASPSGPPVDPTKNVLDLVAAAMERQDDLRDALAHRLDTKIDGNDRLSAERHEFTRRELVNIEQRRLEHKEDTRSTVDTAFAGAEKAIAKSERAAADQIKSVEGSVDDLKDRVLRLETQHQTKSDTRSDSRASVGMMIAIGMAVLGFLSLMVTVGALLMRSGQ